MKIIYTYEKEDSLICNRCTCFESEQGRFLFVIQQRYNPEYKYTWWGPIDRELADRIGGKLEELEKNLDEDYMIDHNCDLVEVRKVIWALGLPKIRKQEWETHF